MSNETNETRPSTSNFIFGVKLFVIAGVVLALLWLVDKAL